MHRTGLDASGEFLHVAISFNKTKRYDHLLRTFVAMRKRSYHQEEVLCKVALVAAIKLERRGMVMEICGGLNKADTTSADLFSFALETARNLKQHDLVELISTSMNNQTTTSMPLVETEEATEILDGHIKRTSNRVAAYSSALRGANEKKKNLSHILDAMLTHSKKSSATYYLNALRSATKAKQYDLVVQIYNNMAKNGVPSTQDMCEVMLKSCASASDLETALGVRSSMRCCGLEITESMAYSLVKCATKADQWDAFIDIITDLRNGGTKPTMIMYTMGLNECSKRHRFDAAVDIYRVMPEEFRAQLVGRSLGVVIRGHALLDNKEVQLRAIDIMNEHKSDGKTDDKKLTGAQASTAVNEPATPSRGNARQEAVGSSGKGILDYLSSFFKR